MRSRFGAPPRPAGCPRLAPPGPDTGSSPAAAQPSPSVTTVTLYHRVDCKTTMILNDQRETVGTIRAKERGLDREKELLIAATARTEAAAVSHSAAAAMPPVITPPVAAATVR